MSVFCGHHNSKVLIHNFMIKGLDDLDENSGAGSDNESVYDKSYIDLPHSANAEMTRSITISIKGKPRCDNYMCNLKLLDKIPFILAMILSVGKLL